jgi:aryl-alcohol dehydrogenase-like predicted oxidoreductase
MALLREEAGRLGTTVDALSLAAALAQPWADTVLIGAASVPQLHANLLAADLTLDDDLSADLAMPPAEYWAERATLPWN